MSETSYDGVFKFYRDRITSCRNYGFKAGHELLDVIMRCVYNDSALTTDEINSIMILAETAHIMMMEDNYNEGWKDQ